MPLVQSLDLLKRRVTSPVFRRPGRRPRAGARRTALSDAFAAHGEFVPQHLHGVAGRRGAERQPRQRSPPICRVHEGHRHCQAEDGLGARLPGDPDHARAGPGLDHRAEGRADVLRLLRLIRRRLPLVTRIIVAISDS